MSLPITDLGSKPLIAWPSEWPELDRLGGELPKVPVFDDGLLPASLQPLVRDVSERMQTPIDFPAVTALGTLAGMCQRRARIQPKTRDHSWIVVPNLWGALVGPPGVLKSPSITCITQPARSLEASWRHEQAEAMQRFEVAQERERLDAQVWAEQYKAAKKSGKPLPAKQQELSIAPSPKRLLAVDATFEQLHQLLATNAAGLFVVRDELTGWLSGLGKQGRETERSFFLECWNGDSPFTVDRVGRGSIHVEHCCVSLFGGIQPSRLRDYLSEVLENGASDDGLFQRFQLVAWPDVNGSWKYCDRIPDASALRAAEFAYTRIASIPLEQELILKFAPDAQELFVDWLTHLETRLRAGELADCMVSHLSKFRSLMPSLALLLSLADGATESVDLEHTKQAADLCGYFESHAKRIYASRATPERIAAESLGKKLQAGWRQDFGVFTVRDVYQNDWSGLSTADEVRAAITVLEEGGWVRLKPDTRDSKGGRPSENYEISPRIGGLR
jgi:Protein of unknown function (DUF3987)